MTSPNAEPTGVDHDVGGLDNHKALVVANASKSDTSSREYGTNSPFNENIQTKPWRSTYLKGIVLGTFMGAFTALAITLAALYGVSCRFHGITNADSKYHYIWTYAPTAIFTILSVFWVRVDYRIKTLMPWKEMASGSGTAEKTVLLDYISQFNLKSIWNSAKAGHYIVTCSIVAALSLTLAVVLSSGLFELDTIMVTDDNLPIIITDGFDRAWRDPRTSLDVVNASQPSLQVFAYYTDNLSLPFGTTDSYAYQSFNTTKSLANATITAEIEALSVDINCRRVIEVRPTTNESLIVIGAIGEMTDGDCTGLPLTIQKSKDDFLLTTSLMCGNMPYGSEEGRRLIIAAGHCSNNCTIDSLQQHAIMICTPSYKIEKALVSFETGTGQETLNPTVSIIPNTASTPLTINSSYWDSAWTNSIGQGVAANWITEGAGYGESAATGFFAYLNSTLPQQSISGFQDYDVLHNASQRFVGAWAAQHVRSQMMISLEDNTTGTIKHGVSRLMVRTLSFVLIEVILCALIGGVLFIYLQSRDVTLSRDPSSIGGLSIILARSPDLVRAVRNHGSSPTQSIETHLQGRRFHLASSDDKTRPTAIVSGDSEKIFDEPSKSGNIPEPAEKIEWYLPFAVTRVFGIVMVVILIVLIIILQVMNKYSKDHDGIADLPEGQFPHYAFTYIPTLVFVFVGIFLASLDFSIKVFQPFHVLRLGSAPAQTSIMENFLGETSLHSLIQSMTRNHHYPVIATSIAMLITPFLTIIVSGLFQTQSIPQSWNAAFQQVDALPTNLITGINATTNALISTQDSDYVLPLELVLFHNLSYPRWTHKNLAFPQLGVADIENFNKHKLNGSSTKVRLPAVRGRSNCSNIPYSAMTKAAYSTKFSTVQFNSTGAPQGCNLPSSSGFESKTPYDGNNFAFTNIHAGTDSYFGQWIDVYTPDDLLSGNYSHCPWNWVFFGYVNGNATSDLTALYCWPFLEQVEVDVTLNVPSLTIESQIEPVVDESTAKVYSKSSLYGLVSAMVDGISTDSMHSFFDAIFRGNDGIPEEGLLGEKNVLILQDAVDKTYGKAVAQALNTQRIPLSSSSSPLPQFNTIVTTPNRLRVIQNSASTHVLTALLAVLALCTTFAFLVMDVRDVLPKNPCSIAALASMLAGSEVLSERVLPKESEIANDSNLRRKDAFEGWLFSLGWWSHSEGHGQRFGIEVGEENRLDS